MGKLLDLISDDKALVEELESIKAEAMEEGYESGISEGIKKSKAGKTGIVKKQDGPEKPKCFKKYKAGFEEHPSACRKCYYAQECKGKKGK